MVFWGFVEDFQLIENLSTAKIFFVEWVRWYGQHLSAFHWPSNQCCPLCLSVSHIIVTQLIWKAKKLTAPKFRDWLLMTETGTLLARIRLRMPSQGRNVKKASKFSGKGRLLCRCIKFEPNKCYKNNQLWILNEWNKICSISI